MSLSRRAILELAGLAALLPGARGPYEVEVVGQVQTGGDPEFARLLEAVRRRVGLA